MRVHGVRDDLLNAAELRLLEGMGGRIDNTSSPTPEGLVLRATPSHSGNQSHPAM